jgi:vitamin B12 transporter
VPIRLDRVAGSVTVLTAADLRVAGYKTVADALRDTPAANVVETGSFGGQTSLFMRGGESDYVKVLLDGVALNQPGGAFDFADLSLENVERIEIVRGPGSVLYGSDAMTGVIQIFTRAGLGPGRATAAVRAGTFGAVELTAGLAGAVGLLGYSTEVGRFTAEGQLPFNNQYERSVGGARLRLAPDPRTDISLAVRYTDQTYHYPTDGAGNLVDSNTFRFERGPAWTLDAGYAVSPRLAVRVSYGVKTSEQGIDDRADGPADTLGFYGFQSLDRVRRTSLGARADWRWRRGVLTFGTELERQRLDARSASQSEYGAFTDAPLHPRRRNDALYVQALTGLDGPFTLQAGLRWDENGQHGRFVTVRAGAAYRVDPDTRLRAALGTGFKEPTLFENFARGFVLGNPALAPERTRSWEAGLEHRVGRAALSVTYFDQHFRDLVEFTFSPAPPDTVNYFNITGAVAGGVEAELRADVGRGWAATLRYTYLDTRVTDPGFETGPDAAFAPRRRLIRRPTDQAGLRLHGPLGGHGAVALGVRHAGSRDDLDFTAFPAVRVTLRPATHVDVGVRYDIAVGSGFEVTLTARVENLLGDDTREIANLPARGRVVLIGGAVRSER